MSTANIHGGIMSKESERIAKLEKKQQQIRAQLQAMKSLASKRERKLDTRKKILVGALVLEWMEKDEDMKQKVLSHLQRFLTRQIDRDIFGFSAQTEKKKPGSES
jgi:large subunit ribosomal protein L7/L12